MSTVNLFPEHGSPYFIWGLPWDQNSSGIRCLHLLCHALNQMGQRAYLVPVNTWYRTNPGLNTHVLTEEHNAYYQTHGISPIVIYPDIVQGNPWEASKVVRWLLAPAGLYGGDKTFPETDKVYGYTKNIHPNILCPPTFDQKIFYPPPEGSERKGDCFYAHKYIFARGNDLPLTEGMTPCKGNWEEVAAILRTHESCYIYERSEIMVTAAMCGCKVKPVITDYWDGDLPEEFFNQDGSLVPHERLMSNFEGQLSRFIKDTQDWS